MQIAVSWLRTKVLSSMESLMDMGKGDGADQGWPAEDVSGCNPPVSGPGAPGKSNHRITSWHSQTAFTPR